MTPGSGGSGPSEGQAQGKPSGERVDLETARASVRTFAAAMGITGLVVLPLVILALGGFGSLGYCYEGCTDLQTMIYWAIWLVPIAVYALVVVKMTQRLNAAIDPQDPRRPISGGATFGAVVIAIILILFGSVITCFAAIAAAGG